MKKISLAIIATSLLLSVQAFAGSFSCNPEADAIKQNYMAKREALVMLRGSLIASSAEANNNYLESVASGINTNDSGNRGGGAAGNDQMRLIMEQNAELMSDALDGRTDIVNDVNSGLSYVESQIAGLDSSMASELASLPAMPAGSSGCDFAVSSSPSAGFIEPSNMGSIGAVSIFAPDQLTNLQNQSNSMLAEVSRTANVGGGSIFNSCVPQAAVFAFCEGPRPCKKCQPLRACWDNVCKEGQNQY